jgi:hypothetical protein
MKLSLISWSNAKYKNSDKALKKKDYVLLYPYFTEGSKEHLKIESMVKTLEGSTLVDRNHTSLSFVAWIKTQD